MSYPFPADLRSLTALRFVAAAWVLVFHLGAFVRPDSIGAIPRNSRGYLGVDFFFVLSGFILTHVYLAKWEGGTFSYRSFLLHRFARVYPLHLLVLVANIALFGGLLLAGLAPRPVDWTQIPFVALLLHGWGFLGTLDWNDPSWSVSAEWFAYLTFPLFLLATSIYRQFPFAGFLATVGLFSLIYIMCPMFLGASLTHLTYDFGIARIVPEFAMGSAMYMVALRVILAPQWSGALTFVGVLAILGVLAFGGPDWAIVLLLAAVIYGVAEGDRTGWTGALQSRMATWLGEISYGVYIIHFLVYYMWFGALKVLADLEPRDVPWLATLPPIPISVACAGLTYRFVEVPARRWIRDRGSPAAVSDRPA